MVGRFFLNLGTCIANLCNISSVRLNHHIFLMIPFWFLPLCFVFFSPLIPLGSAASSILLFFTDPQEVTLCEAE